MQALSLMTENSEKARCRRCHRLFTPTKSDQVYGEKCLRKMAGQTILQDLYVVPPRKRHGKNAGTKKARLLR